MGTRNLIFTKFFKNEMILQHGNSMWLIKNIIKSICCSTFQTEFPIVTIDLKTLLLFLDFISH